MSYPPLFPTIPFINVVVDNLHLFLRVADVLINHLIEELCRQDAIDKAKKFSTFECSKYWHIYHYEKFVSTLGIPSYNFYIGQASKQLKVRTLTGPEKLKLFRHIDIPSLLPSIDPNTTLLVQDLWKRFLKINELLSARPENVTEDVIQKYESMSREWGMKFLEVCQTKEVTPYIHVVICHVGELMRIRMLNLLH